MSPQRDSIQAAVSRQVALAMASMEQRYKTHIVDLESRVSLADRRAQEEQRPASNVADHLRSEARQAEATAAIAHAIGEHKVAEVERIAEERLTTRIAHTESVAEA